MTKLTNQINYFRDITVIKQNVNCFFLLQSLVNDFEKKIIETSQSFAKYSCLEDFPVFSLHRQFIYSSKSCLMSPDPKLLIITFKFWRMTFLFVVTERGFPRK